MPPPLQTAPRGCSSSLRSDPQQGAPDGAATAAWAVGKCGRVVSIALGAHKDKDFGRASSHCPGPHQVPADGAVELSPNT
eukprot:365098-Chlamydomonas_euryale.AAC.2